jgi:PAS domain S-box-containing protein
METGDVHSHDWARQVIDCTSYAVVVADNNGVIREWNESARALFGYTAAEAVGLPVELIIPQSLRAAHSACFAKAMNSGRGYSRAYESTVPARRRDGITIQIRGISPCFRTTAAHPAVHRSSFAWPKSPAMQSQAHRERHRGRTRRTARVFRNDPSHCPGTTATIGRQDA